VQKFCRFQNPTKRALIYESDIMRSCYEKTGIPPAFRSRVMKKTLNGAVERRGVTIEPDCEKADERPFRILLFARRSAHSLFGDSSNSGSCCLPVALSGISLSCDPLRVGGFRTLAPGFQRERFV